MDKLHILQPMTTTGVIVLQFQAHFYTQKNKNTHTRFIPAIKHTYLQNTVINGDIKVWKINQDHYNMSDFVLQYKKKLAEAQVQLEQQHRKEEDALLRDFQMEREREKQKLSDEMNKEWEVKLKELTDMFERDFGKKKKKMDDRERKVSILRYKTHSFIRIFRR